jgi:hypothetical protein
VPGPPQEKLEPDRAGEPFHMPRYAALCRDLQAQRRNSPSLLAFGSVFEPEGRGFESLPAYHFKINTLGVLLREFSQVDFPSSAR